METLPARVDLEEIQSLAQLMIQSKMFSDIQGVAQGAVRILAGRELGIGPVASLRSIEIVRGNLSIRSHLMAAMIKRSQRYNYRVTASTDERCVIEFLEQGEVCGTSEFTTDDAKRASLLGNDSWKRYPKTMLYNRAMSQGARMYCPDIFLGGVFYESEIIEAEGTTSETTPVIDVEPEPVSEKQLGLIYGLLKKHGVQDGDKRELIEFAHPNGLAKVLATKIIEHVNSEGTLPGYLRKFYVNMLVKKHKLLRQEVAAHMTTAFGTNDPEKLTEGQFLMLVTYLTAPKDEEPDDIYLPGEELKEVSVLEWVDFIKETCKACNVTTTDFKHWAIKQFGNGSVEDVTLLPKEAYHSLKAMDLDHIETQVKEFISVEDKQVTLEV
jgi:hypothetical protein